MRVYINGVLSKPQKSFGIVDLWFSTEKCEENTEVSVDCICLSGNMWWESSVDDDGMQFSCRWKIVECDYIDNNGLLVETCDIGAKEFLDIIKRRGMRLVNASAIYDTDVDVKITEFLLVDGVSEERFDLDLIDDIEFISD